MRVKSRRKRRLSLECCERRNLLTTVELLPIADNTLFEDTAGAISNGVGDHFFAGTVGAAGGNELRRGLVRFDLSSIPSNATINSVSVQLTVSRTVSGDVPVNLHTVLADWGEGASDAPGQEGQGTTAFPGDATWVHSSFPSPEWENVGGDFNPNSSATIPVGPNGLYTWTSDQLAADVLGWLADPSTNFGWIVVGDESNSGTAKRFDTRENPTEANRPRLIVDFDVPGAGGDLDFGDAPSAAQSGFASSYPVTLAEDGARHTITDLFLGNEIDSEADGLPSIDAIGDSGDDGVQFVSSLISGLTPTTSSLSINASGSGFIDAWIDFNLDGDWDDAGEQILASASVDSGTSLHAFTIPENSNAGNAGVRVRLSSTGGLSPTGAAADGEVEDYVVPINSSLAGSSDAFVNLPGESTDLVVVAGQTVVRTNSIDLFSVPQSSLGQLTINGDSANTDFSLNFTGGDVIPAGGLNLDATTGQNTLRLIGGDGELDLTLPEITIENFGTLDLGETGANTIVVNAATVDALAPATGSVAAVGGEEDLVVFSDEAEWLIGSTSVNNNQFVRSLVHTSGVSLEADLGSAWQNIIRPSDVNNSGTVTAVDALAIINELAARNFSDPDTSAVIDPTLVPTFPDLYYDQSGDGFVTALDALRVINQLAEDASASQFAATPSQFLAATAEGEAPLSGESETASSDPSVDSPVESTLESPLQSFDQLSRLTVPSSSLVDDANAEDSLDSNNDRASAVDQLLTETETDWRLF